MSLAETLKDRIRRSGPISVAEYMDACVSAYYARGDVFGTGGDFITAPEISQAFGEIVGLWCAVTWQGLGSPKTFRLIECGPGRGTLMSDALRAASAVPGFRDAARIHLVERSPALRERQRKTLEGMLTSWHDDIEDVPAGCAIVIANEFLDALPIRQWEKTGGGWSERTVDWNEDGRFRFARGTARDLDIPLPLSADAAEGAIFETSPAVIHWTRMLAHRIAEDGGAALVIDYGHTRTAIGDTLQAVRRHQFHDPLSEPGEADLTAHIDFESVGAAAREMGTKVFGPISQGTWLTRLGITVRGAQLAAGKYSTRATDVHSAIKRLIAPQEMGSLFKVLSFAHPKLEACEGFGEDAVQ